MMVQIGDTLMMIAQYKYNITHYKLDNKYHYKVL